MATTSISTAPRTRSPTCSPRTARWCSSAANIVGHKGVKRLYGDWIAGRFTGGKPGPVNGLLLDHFQMQDVITVAPDRKTAKGRFHGILLGGWHDDFQETREEIMPQQFMEAGIYENDYVKVDGVWKIKRLDYMMQWQANYEEGWAHTTAHLQPADEDLSGRPARPRPPAAARAAPQDLALSPGRADALRASEVRRDAGGAGEEVRPARRGRCRGTSTPAVRPARHLEPRERSRCARWPSGSSSCSTTEDNPVDAFTCWMHPDYIQHNPNAPTGRDATLAFLAAAVTNNPELTHDVKRVIYGDDGPRRGPPPLPPHARRARLGGRRYPADRERLRRRALGRDAAGARSGRDARTATGCSDAAGDCCALHQVCLTERRSALRPIATVVNVCTAYELPSSPAAARVIGEGSLWLHPSPRLRARLP